MLFCFESSILSCHGSGGNLDKQLSKNPDAGDLRRHSGHFDVIVGNYVNFSTKYCKRTLSSLNTLTHWGRLTHICVGNLTIIGSDNGLSPGRRQAIIWTNAGILLIRTLGTNFSEIFSEVHTFSFKRMHLKMSSAKWRPFCLGLNVVTEELVEHIWSVAAKTASNAFMITIEWWILRF